MKKIMRNNTWLNILNLISIMSVAILLPNLGNTADRVTGSQFLTRSPVLANNAMAATSQPLATQVALEIMRKGGNAMDAAIAANAMLGLVEPTGNGLSLIHI